MRVIYYSFAKNATPEILTAKFNSDKQNKVLNLVV